MQTIPTSHSREKASGRVVRCDDRKRQLRNRAADDRRRIRWNRRATMWAILDRAAALESAKLDDDGYPLGRKRAWARLPSRRLGGCGRSMHFGHDGTECVQLRAKWTENGPKAFYGNIQSCSSIWACACCSAIIRSRRSIEVQFAAAAHVASGGRLAMLTLTIRHKRRHSLAELLDALRRSWRQVQQDRPWRAHRGELVGSITALEVTQGPNGWHPHLHLLLFLPAGQVTALEDWLREELPALWRDTVAEHLDVAPDLGHGTHLLYLDARAAQYVAKIADETTRSDLKSDAKSPWVLLDQAAALVHDGDTAGSEPLARWLEYVSATKGKRAIVWSRGLKAHFGLEELTDEDVREREEQESFVVETLEPAAYRKSLRTRNDRGTITAVANLEKWETRLARATRPETWGMGPRKATADPPPP